MDDRGHLWPGAAFTIRAVAEPDLIPISKASSEFRLSRSVIFKYLQQGKLQRWQKMGDQRTFIDRQELKRLLQPRIKGRPD